MFRGESAQYAQEVRETARDRAVEVQEKIVEHRMQEHARKGIGAQGGTVLPEDWNVRTLRDLRHVQELSQSASGADTLSDADWGLLHHAGRIFGSDARTLSPEQLELLTGLATESESAEDLTLHTLFDRLQVRNEHIERVRVQTIKAKGHL